MLAFRHPRPSPLTPSRYISTLLRRHERGPVMRRATSPFPPPSPAHAPRSSFTRPSYVPALPLIAPQSKIHSLRALARTRTQRKSKIHPPLIPSPALPFPRSPAPAIQNPKSTPPLCSLPSPLTTPPATQIHSNTRPFSAEKPHVRVYRRPHTLAARYTRSPPFLGGEPRWRALRQAAELAGLKTRTGLALADLALREMDETRRRRRRFTAAFSHPATVRDRC